MAASEAELVRRTLAGDRFAFAKLVEPHKDAVFGLVGRLIGQESDIEDVMQESFLRAYRGLASFSGDAEFGTWLYRIVWNCCLAYQHRHSRRKDRETSVALQDEDGEPTEYREEHVPLPDELLEADETRRRLVYHLARLPLRYKAVLTLRYFAGLKYEEIARVLDVPMNTVKVQIHRATAQLKEALLADSTLESQKP